MSTPETTKPVTEPTTRARRRILWLAAPLVAGAAIGVGGYAGLTGGDSATPATSTAAPVVSTSTNVASTAAQFDAATIYEMDSPGVVDIEVTQTSQGTGQGLSPFAPGGSQATAQGTGYVYDKAGNIITAEHVVSGASKISVRFQDGTIATAKLVGTDPSTDTAVINVSVPAAKLKPLALANSEAVVPGEGVVAIGSPFGYSGSITAGIVSAIDRNIQAPNGFSIPNTIQTDAAINHGNSGGPLIDASGKVIGTNVQIALDTQSSGNSDNAGVGFAVPSNTVKSVADALIAGKTVQHAYLGVSVGDSPSGSGALIGTVRAGGPAATGGLKAGDTVTAIDGAAIVDSNGLTASVAGHKPGDKIALKVTRDGSTLDLTVTLGTRPASTTA